jgi:hypothetical protein
MSLRPRYSLLTLLLLTAAVAVGIKLWRGPHRVSVSSVPTFTGTSTGLQRIALWKNVGHFTMTGNSQPLQDSQDQGDAIECEYVRNWSNNTVTTACETWKKPRYLVRVQEPQMGRMHLIVESASPLSPELINPLLTNNPAKIESIEQLSCWIAGNSEGTKIECQPRVVPLLGPVIHFNIQVSDQPFHPVYYLTTTGKIFQLATIQRLPMPQLEPEFDLEPVTLEAISDPLVRARVSERLAAHLE